LFFFLLAGLCCAIQTSESVKATLQEDPKLLENRAKAEEPGDLCSGENH
jgi:hypothetical protein